MDYNGNDKKIQILITANLRITPEDDISTDEGRKKIDQGIRDEIQDVVDKFGDFIDSADSEFAYSSEGDYQFEKKRDDPKPGPQIGLEYRILGTVRSGNCIDLVGSRVVLRMADGGETEVPRDMVVKIE